MSPNQEMSDAAPDVAARSRNRGKNRLRPNAPMRLGFLTEQLDRVLTGRLSVALARHGLTLMQYAVLSTLRNRARTAEAPVAERSIISRQAAALVVTPMEAGGWVKRDIDVCNPRRISLSLTETGKKLLAETDAAAELVESATLGDTSENVPLILRELLLMCLCNHYTP